MKKIIIIAIFALLILVIILRRNSSLENIAKYILKEPQTLTEAKNQEELANQVLDIHKQTKDDQFSVVHSLEDEIEKCKQKTSDLNQQVEKKRSEYSKNKTKENENALLDTYKDLLETKKKCLDITERYKEEDKNLDNIMETTQNLETVVESKKQTVKNLQNDKKKDTNRNGSTKEIEKAGIIGGIVLFVGYGLRRIAFEYVKYYMRNLDKLKTSEANQKIFELSRYLVGERNIFRERNKLWAKVQINKDFGEWSNDAQIEISLLTDSEKLTFDNLSDDEKINYLRKIYVERATSDDELFKVHKKGSKNVRNVNKLEKSVKNRLKKLKNQTDKDGKFILTNEKENRIQILGEVREKYPLENLSKVFTPEELSTHYSLNELKPHFKSGQLATHFSPTELSEHFSIDELKKYFSPEELADLIPKEL